MTKLITAALCFIAASAAPATPLDFTFSAGFSDDAVLQRAPAKAAIYGLTPSGDATVMVTVTDDSGASYSVAAAVSPPGERAGGTSDPLCMARCYAAGHCALGSTSQCQKPSCAMGCIISGVVDSADKCKAICANKEASASAQPAQPAQQRPPATFPRVVGAGDGCVINLVGPAGEWHEPGVTTANQTLQMCAGGGPTLINGSTLCSSCSGDVPECALGCDAGFLGGGGGGGTPPGPATWKAFLKPTAAGGSVRVSVSSSDAPGAAPIVLRRQTFGDVFVCGGQSNMDLALQYTFSKPALDAAVRAGAYDSLRLFMYGNMGRKYIESKPVWATTQGALPRQPVEGGGCWANMSRASKAIGGLAAATETLLTQFSATCFYFGASVADANRANGEGDVPIGLLQSAIGGSQIEAWTPDSALGACAGEQLNADGQAPPGRLYNGMIAPFVNMTVKGFLWYQGENNCGNPDGMGNSANRSGYGCQLPALVAEWRRLWSATPGTTDALAPFGVVTLAAGGSEGHDESMAGMRWSQTANYGALPNAALPNTFLAHAYDLGDPMDNLGAPCVNQSDGAVNASAFDPGAGGPCVWPPASKWNVAVRPLRDVVFRNGAPSFMGGIHPRFKREVGRRLALAFLGATSPTIAGCEVSSSAARIELRLSVDGSDPVALQWVAEDYNQSTWGGNGDSSTLMVCAGAASAAACLDGSGDMANWFAAPLALSGAAVGSVQKLSVDLGALHGKQPQAIRYGWPLSRGADTCCPAKAVRSGLEPCVPGSCPIITATHALPANPFYATISAAGKCECMAPQVCDA